MVTMAKARREKKNCTARARLDNRVRHIKYVQLQLAGSVTPKWPISNTPLISISHIWIFYGSVCSALCTHVAVGHSNSTDFFFLHVRTPHCCCNLISFSFPPHEMLHIVRSGDARASSRRQELLSITGNGSARASSRSCF
jgi:hypothetical protein